MADKKIFATLMSNLGFGAAAPAVIVAASGADGEPTEISAAQMEAALQSAHGDGVKEGHDAGFKAATDRFNAVMGSDAGKANPQGAIAMLSDPDLAGLTAEKINAKLPLFGAPPAPPADDKTKADASKEKAGLSEEQLREQNKPLDLKGDKQARQVRDDGGKDTKAADDKALDEVIFSTNNGLAGFSNHLPGSIYGAKPN